jgi:tellurite resistance protein TerC
LIESGIWIGIALTFNIWFGFTYGRELGLEFLTGYLVEKSLSVDNLFVILLIFSSFRIPDKYQHRVLFYGVLGAMILRAIFIILGGTVTSFVRLDLYVFGGILVITAIKFLRESDEKIDVKENWSIRIIRRIIPTSNAYNGNHFFIKENGIRKATPLFLALIAVEVTDLIFAVDSIPAVFAVTQDAFVAFASNIWQFWGCELYTLC